MARVTVSTTVDVSDSLDEARTRLLKTARALNGAWAAALCSMGCLVVASLALLLVAMTIRPVLRRHLVGAAGGDQLQPDPVLAPPPGSSGPAARPAGGRRTAHRRRPGRPAEAGPTRSGWSRGPSSSWPRASWRSGCPCWPASTRASSGSCWGGRGAGIGRGRADGAVGTPGRARRHRPAAGGPPAAADLADLAADRGAPRPRRPARRGPRQLGGGLRTGGATPPRVRARS